MFLLQIPDMNICIKTYLTIYPKIVPGVELLGKPSKLHSRYC